MAHPLGVPAVSMFSDLLRRDHERAGLTIEEAARRIDVAPTFYRLIEAADRWPEWPVYERTAETFGWPRSFR
jgi:hypothetical protein